MRYHPHPPARDCEAQPGEVTCLQSHSWDCTEGTLGSGIECLHLQCPPRPNCLTMGGKIKPFENLVKLWAPSLQTSTNIFAYNFKSSKPPKALLWTFQDSLGVRDPPFSYHLWRYRGREWASRCHDGTACGGWPCSQIFLESDGHGFWVLDQPLLIESQFPPL